MKNKIFLSLILSFFFLSACLPKEENKPTTEEISEKNILDIQEIKTKNGLTIWFVEDHSLPIISLKFSFKNAGSIQDGIEKQGLARLLSNTMDEGAGDLTSQKFQKSLSDNSITLSFTSNRDNFGGQLKTLTRNKDKAFELLKLALTAPRFDEAPVERMRQANIVRLKSSIGNPEWIQARLFNDIAFQGHPYAFNSGGTLTTLNNITIDDLRQHQQTWLTQENLVIGVTGDIQTKKLQHVIHDVFGALPEKTPTDQAKKINLQNTGKIFSYHKDIPQTILSTTLSSLDKNDPDYYALRVANFIYGGGGFGSRLMEKAREERGLTYGIYSSLSTQNYADTLHISTSTKNESAAEMLKIINEEMLQIRNTPVTAKELKNAKDYLTGSMPLSLTSTDKVASILLGLQLNERPKDYLNHYKRNINNVTIEDIQRVSKRIFHPESSLTIMVGKPENIEEKQIIESIPNVE